MRQIPGEPAAKFEAVKYLVPAIQEVRTLFLNTLHQRSDPGAAFVRSRRTPGRRSESDEVFQAVEPNLVYPRRAVVRKQRADHLHSRRMNDGVEWLILIQ